MRRRQRTCVLDGGYGYCDGPENEMENCAENVRIIISRK